MCQRAVREWLVFLTMEKYIDKFLERGLDSIANCRLILARDLTMLGIDDPSHRKLLLDGVQFLINSAEIFICQEPCDLHAQNYELEIDVDISKVKLKSNSGESSKINFGFDFGLMSAFKSLEKTEASETPTFPSPTNVDQEVKPVPHSNKQISAKPEIGIDFSFLSAFNSLEKPTLTEFTPKSSTMCLSQTEPIQSEAMIPHATNENIANSFQYNIPTVTVNVTYSCEACPHLKFNNASELKEHLFQSNKVDGIRHKSAPLRVESFITINDFTMIALD